MAYSAVSTLTASATFQAQVLASIVSASLAIMAEATTQHITAENARTSLAHSVLNSATSYGNIFNLPVAVGCVGAGQTTPTDAQVDIQVSSVWNAIAGVTLAQLNTVG